MVNKDFQMVYVCVYACICGYASGWVGWCVQRKPLIEMSWNLTQ